MGPLDLRYLSAAGILFLYAALCVLHYWRLRQLQRDLLFVHQALSHGVGSPVVIAYASQTGYGRGLAWEAANALRDAGIPTRLASMAELDAASLTSTERLLLIASTYGEGDPPDNGALFVRRVMAAAPDLSGLRYAVLALGDSSYRNFCRFGRELDTWLATRGASAMFPRIELDNADAAALGTWREACCAAFGARMATTVPEPAFAPWHLARREQLNPGSLGSEIFHLELKPPDGVVATWQAGDLVEVVVPADPSRPREYSIASLPGHGSLHLVVRLERHADGSKGLASSWLCGGVAAKGDVLLRLKTNRNFHLAGNESRRLILVGNGTGIAGLRAHLHARALDGLAGNWLIFGERNAAHDYLYRGELEAWVRNGTLTHLDMVFSRDGATRTYVQHRLTQEAWRLREWVDRGAAVYVCGSLAGMAAGVDLVLWQVLGRETMDELMAQGRYRRDVY